MNHSSTTFRTVAAGIALLGLLLATSAQAQRSTPVTVVNPADQPVPVTSTGIAGTPVQGSTSLVVPAGESADIEPLFDPPAGTLLVIEYLTIAVDSRNVEEQGVVALRTRLDGVSELHRLGPLPPLIRTGIGSGFGQELQRTVRLYSDDIVDAVYQRGTGFDTERAIVRITFSGRLIPAP